VFICGLACILGLPGTRKPDWLYKFQGTQHPPYDPLSGKHHSLRCPPMHCLSTAFSSQGHHSLFFESRGLLIVGIPRMQGFPGCDRPLRESFIFLGHHVLERMAEKNGRRHRRSRNTPKKRETNKIRSAKLGDVCLSQNSQHAMTIAKMC